MEISDTFPTSTPSKMSDTKERFLVLKTPLPPSVDVGVAYQKAITRSEQRQLYYADQDRMVNEGIKLISEKLI